VIAVRLLWVFLTFRSRNVRDPLSVPERVVVGWTGMRGVVTLAAAAGIPPLLENGAPFPGRPEIQAIAFMVAVGTLLLQGSTLPWLIRRLGISEDAAERAQIQQAQERASAVAREGAMRAFAHFVAHPPEGLDPAFVQEMADRMERRRAATAEALAERDAGGAAARAFATLRQDAIDQQRSAVIAGLRAGELDDDAVREFLDQLDYEEAALASRLDGRL
jgi:CPA1 family monovalent cation:H+ antiporter